MSEVNIDADTFGEARLMLFGVVYRLPGQTEWTQGPTKLGVAPADLPFILGRGLRGVSTSSQALGVMVPLSTSFFLLSFVASVLPGDLAWVIAIAIRCGTEYDTRLRRLMFAFRILSMILVFSCMFVQDAWLKQVRRSVDGLLIEGITTSGTASWLLLPAFLLGLFSIPLQGHSDSKYVSLFMHSGTYSDSVVLDVGNCLSIGTKRIQVPLMLPNSPSHLTGLPVPPPNIP